MLSYICFSQILIFDSSWISEVHSVIKTIYIRNYLCLPSYIKICTWSHLSAKRSDVNLLTVIFFAHNISVFLINHFFFYYWLCLTSAFDVNSYLVSVFLYFRVILCWPCRLVIYLDIDTSTSAKKSRRNYCRFILYNSKIKYFNYCPCFP